MQNKRILLIGEVYVDHHLDIVGNEGRISRLGGIFHAIRACNALGLEFAFAYYGPTYLEEDINQYGTVVLGAKKVYQLGIVDRAPNVMLIGKSDESGNQLYDNILCKQVEYIEKMPLRQVVEEFMPSDIMIFPGRYGNSKVLNSLLDYEGRLHIDMNYDCTDILKWENTNIETVFLSTSSTTYAEYFKEESYEPLIECFSSKNIQKLLVKENRGGSWCYDFQKNKSYESPAFTSESLHSVGVGDVYDIAYICEMHSVNTEYNMRLASWVASRYSCTLKHEKFIEDVKILIQNVGNVLDADGIRVPWNQRKEYPIYMAAPDFDHVDTKNLDDLVEALRYHNFCPRLPVRENGQVNEKMDIGKELEVFGKDLELLKECKLMIATLLYNDQGTLVEIGNYQANKKPIILFDPYKKMDNMFLKNSCEFYCSNVSEVVDVVFQLISRMVTNEK